MNIIDQDSSDKKYNKNDYHDAALCHWIGLLGLFSTFFGLIANVIVYFNMRDKSDFVRHHAMVALNFMLTLFIVELGIGLIVIMVFMGGFFDLFSSVSTHQSDGFSTIKPAFGSFFGSMMLFILVEVGTKIVNLVFCIIGANRANIGEWWHNPLALNIVK